MSKGAIESTTNKDGSKRGSGFLGWMLVKQSRLVLLKETGFQSAPRMSKPSSAALDRFKAVVGSLGPL